MAIPSLAGQNQILPRHPLTEVNSGGGKATRSRKPSLSATTTVPLPYFSGGRKGVSCQGGAQAAPLHRATCSRWSTAAGARAGYTAWEERRAAARIVLGGRAALVQLSGCFGRDWFPVFVSGQARCMHQLGVWFPAHGIGPGYVRAAVQLRPGPVGMQETSVPREPGWEGAGAVHARNPGNQTTSKLRRAQTNQSIQTIVLSCGLALRCHRAGQRQSSAQVLPSAKQIVERKRIFFSKILAEFRRKIEPGDKGQSRNSGSRQTEPPCLSPNLRPTEQVNMFYLSLPPK
ncbi:hypothetical protein BS78_04G081600 [Paspalum vaginatum]|nr:hypothetical protein BS78_04G081600 [Paspalum vaginatum]